MFALVDAATIDAMMGVSIYFVVNLSIGVDGCVCVGGEILRWVTRTRVLSRWANHQRGGIYSSALTGRQTRCRGVCVF